MRAFVLAFGILLGIPLLGGPTDTPDEPGATSSASPGATAPATPGVPAPATPSATATPTPPVRPDHLRALSRPRVIIVVPEDSTDEERRP